MTVVLAVMANAGALFVASRNFVQQQILSVETTQALRATLDNLERDLRLGGACLPTIGDFVALSGTDGGTTDTLVTRTGLVTASLTCVRTTIQNTTPAASRQLNVVSTAGFTDGVRAYIRNSDGTGEFFTVTHVQPSTSTLQTDVQLSHDYPAGSGVYGIDEHAYAIDTSNASLPVLVLAVNNGSAFPFASGIESFNVRYILARNCPPCDSVDLPASTAEWTLVNEISVSVTARSRIPGSNGQYYRRTGELTLKPRNLLPGSAVLGSS